VIQIQLLKKWPNISFYIQELREAFEKDALTSKKPKLLLSVAVASGPNVIDTSYNVTSLAKYDHTLRS